VGGLVALLTGAVCGVVWLAEKLAPGLHFRHCFGLRLAPHWGSLWLGALLTVLGLWCFQALILFIQTLAGRMAHRGFWLRLGTTQLLLAVAANLYFGFEFRRTVEYFVISSNPVDIHGERYSAVRIEAMSRRRGRHRPVVAWIERKIDSITDRLRVRHGSSWASVSGEYALSLDRAEVATRGAIVRHGRQRVELTTNQPALAGSDTLVLHGVQNPGTDSATATPKADVTIGGKRTLLPLDPEWTGENALLALKESPVLVLRVHKRIGLSLIVIGLTSVLMGVAMLLGSRRGWGTS
jgi:hypothetical protein